MAWEWVSPVAAASGGLLGGAIGAYFAWLSGKQSRDQISQTLQDQFGHDRLQAREAREQERLQNAYLELLKMTEQVGVWAEMIYPMFEDGPPPDTQLPPFEVQAETAALLAAFGTDEVREKTKAWQLVVRRMIGQAKLVPLQDADPASYVGPGELVARAKIEQQLRPEERRTRSELGAQVRAELAFGYRSTREATGVIKSYTYPDQQPTTGPPNG
jgi:hypothetical protein